MDENVGQVIQLRKIAVPAVEPRSCARCRSCVHMYHDVLVGHGGSVDVMRCVAYGDRRCSKVNDDGACPRWLARPRVQMLDETPLVDLGVRMGWLALLAILLVPVAFGLGVLVGGS